MTYPLMQGIIAGGTAAYLHGKLNQEASKNSSNGWMTAALQVNHLLLLVAENMVLAKAPLGMFGAVVRSAPVLGAIGAGVSVYNKTQGMPFSAQRIEQFSALYRVGVVATSLATLSLGSPVFAAASLSMMAVDVIATGKTKEVFDSVKTVTALFAGVGYGMQIFASEKMSAVVAQVSTILTGGKLFLDWLPETDGLPSTPSTTTTHTVREYHYFRNWGHFNGTPRFSGFPSFSGGNFFCRGSVW